MKTMGEVQPASMASRPEDSYGQVDTTFTLQEVYSDFRIVDSISLPHAYKLIMTIEGPTAYIAEWNIHAGQVTHNQTIDPAVFAVR